MPGRDVSATLASPHRQGSRRALVYLLTGVVVLGIGIAIGSRITTRTQTTPPTVQTATPPTTPSSAAATHSPTATSAHTSTGAAAAAARSITAFDGNVLLNPQQLRTVVERIAAPSARAELVSEFEQASMQTRSELGVGATPHPVTLLRSAPVGYRIEAYSSTRAQVAIWYVGIVGSGATVAPQQSWRTQVVTLVWANGAWKVTSFQSSPGPTPPLANTAQVEAPGELFTTIPSFQEFAGVQP